MRAIPNKAKPSKSELLEELESIHSSLTSSSADDIPVLDDSLIYEKGSSLTEAKSAAKRPPRKIKDKEGSNKKVANKKGAKKSAKKTANAKQASPDTLYDPNVDISLDISISEAELQDVLNDLSPDPSDNYDIEEYNDATLLTKDDIVEEQGLMDFESDGLEESLDNSTGEETGLSGDTAEHKGSKHVNKIVDDTITHIIDVGRTAAESALDCASKQEKDSHTLPGQRSLFDVFSTEDDASYEHQEEPSATNNEEPSATNNEEPSAEKESNNEEPSAVNKEPSAVNKEPSAVNKESSAVNKEPSAVNEEPSAVNEEPSAFNKEPSTTYASEAVFDSDPALADVTGLTISRHIDESSESTGSAREEISDDDIELNLDREADENEHYNQEIFETEEEKAENPFLPQHIKDRLQKNRSSLAEDLSRIDAALAKSNFSRQQPLRQAENSPQNTPKQVARSQTDEQEANMKAIVDELVDQFLPKIEAALRERIAQKLKAETSS